MAKQTFKISKFTNPQGSDAWRVAGTLNGERIRKNFKTRDEATAFRQKLNIRLLNEQNEGQTIWTTLSHAQNADAIAAVNLLKRSKSSKSLPFAVNYFLEHYKESTESKTIEAAVLEYRNEKSRELERGIISSRQERAIKYEMAKLEGFFTGRVIGEIQPEELKKYLDTPLGRSKAVATLKTWNNRRGYISTFFKFCLMKKYLAENPMLEVPQFKIKKSRGTAETLTAKQAEAFMHWLENYRGKQNKNGTWWGSPGCMVPYYALTLFAGIRPDWKDGEMGKLSCDAIRLDTEVIIIEPHVSKTNERRIIKIQPNLRAWLEKYPLSKYPIITKKRFRDMWADVRTQHHLPHDVMRHTYISMTVGAFRSVGDASLQAGNSEAVIRKHYLDSKSTKEADQFWGILPERHQAQPMSKENGRYILSFN
ncbi:hypothetical protein QEH59_04290 [Coraliomargarita sp. SDUM461004]|uniref:Core-binding (CB) domain-containing protein n=1 Tax=Thalassobacterium sedimentorum TaxID=3041258 RepID=A0ABU1AJ37_9BACT|nr:hypothetical protein [Coraliomargarita sp. SDUM461004]MDQ8193628.1 hypothetical protein [Coraliomargarita sp. SDUM461004]